MTDLPDFNLYKVIIVDSDNLFCHQLQTCLRDAGFQVECERKAPSALKRIKSGKPHIVISDYVLHGLDYFDFATQVEELSANARMVLVSSHYLDGPLLAQLRSISRVSLTVQKPIRPEDLLRRIIEFVPEIDLTTDDEPPTEEIDTDYNLDDLDLQQEVSRLHFEGTELPRFVNSLKALTALARKQPHKGKYLREALEQSRRSVQEVKRQRLSHLEAPFERLNNWIVEIIDQGSLPSLETWDYIQQELELLSEPGKRIGTAIMPDLETEEQYTYSLDTHDQLAMPPETVRWPEAPLAKPHAPKPSVVRQMGRLQKFLAIGKDSSDQLLNLASRYGVSIVFKDGLEDVYDWSPDESFDLVLLSLPGSLSGERARETIVSAHEKLRAIETYREIPLAILSAADSLHTRIVTSHLDNSHWMSWSELRKNDAAFLALKTLANQPDLRPTIVIIDSDISDSEELLRELTRSCGRVDAVGDPALAIKAIEENRPDIVSISERTGDLSGFDLCRAISSCLSFKGITVILEVDAINESALKGAFRAGAHGIVCKTESAESRAQSIVSIHQRNLMSRMFVEDSGEKSLEVSAATREALAKDLKTAIQEQLPLVICLIDLSDTVTCDQFARLWNSKQKVISAQNSSSVNFHSPKQILLSVVGMRKSTVQDALEEMLADEQLTGVANSWQFKCRCYPDDALSLSELLRF